MRLSSSTFRLGQGLLPLLSLALLLGSAVAAWAGSEKQAVCCRTSGGTRGSCPSEWAHLVPPGNRFTPGPASQIALLQGKAANPTGMTLRLITMNGQLISEHLLEPRPVGVTVLTLPPLPASSVWESFPTCAPDRPPTRSVIDRALPQADGPTQQMSRTLGRSCGGSVDTAELLRAFDLESLELKLPPSLPVRCETLIK